MHRLDPLAEVAGVKGIIFYAHGLHCRYRLYILHDTDIGRDALVGKTMRIAFLLFWQEGENVRSKHKRRNNNDRFQAVIGIDALFAWVYPVKQEPVGFCNKTFRLPLKMKAVVRLYRRDHMRILINHSAQQFFMTDEVFLQFLTVGAKHRRVHGREKTAPLLITVMAQGVEKASIVPGE